MTFITKLAVSLFFRSLFLIPAAWKSFLHSGGIFLISKEASEGFHPMEETCLKLLGSEMTRLSSSSPPKSPEKNPFFFFSLVLLAGIEAIKLDELGEEGVVVGELAGELV